MTVTMSPSAPAEASEAISVMGGRNRCGHRLHEEQTPGASPVDQLARLIGVHGERLLHQYGLVGLQRQKCVGKVKGCGVAT